MEGFFDIKKYTKKDTRKVGCHACKLHSDNKRINVSGQGKKQILIVGDHPTQREIEMGRCWVGDTGRLLKNALEAFHIDVERDCWTTYAVRCYTSKPSQYVKHCKKYLDDVIKEKQPKLIILLGTAAVQAVIGDRWKKDLGTITKWRGWQIPDQELGCWVCPIMSPRDIIRNKSSKEYLTIFRDDLRQALKLLSPGRVFPNPQCEVKVVEDDPLKQVKFLKWVYEKGREFAFDYETTGLKPHAEGHEIVILSVCNSIYDSYVMIPQYHDKRVLKWLRKVFESKIPKVAQNMKFEHNWTYNILGIEIKNWSWDTMLVSHLLDNRDGVTGLKFQTYVQLGIVDYSSHISKYLKATGSNGLNSIKKAMADPALKRDLLHYCALDSNYTYRIKKWQETLEINSQAFDLLHQGTLALWRAEQNGFLIDLPYYEKMQKHLSRKILKFENQLNADSFIIAWRDKYGAKFNLGSGKQLADMLYNVNEVNPPKYTEKGFPSVDVEALEQIDLPALQKMLEIRKLQKVKDTYIQNFLTEQVEGVVHPFFNLASVISYRSSSSNPNFQNIPKRDKGTMKIIRSGIKARRGCHLVEMDFSKLEVSIAACYHQDPTMMKYLTSEHNDMHGDLAQQIFFVPDKDWDRHNNKCSLLRAAAKNGFIFPQFYGDWYKGNAEGLSQWAKLPQGKWRKGKGVDHPSGGTVTDHFIDNGIKSYHDFEEHLRRIEQDFWRKRFPVYAKWKENHWKAYQENGVIDFHTGFQARGIIRKNSCINYPVQGAAFHCLLWTFIETHKYIQENNLETRLVGQIHDAIIMDIPAEELERVIYVVHDIATKKLPAEWKWITAPLQIEAEVCPLGGCWAEKSDYEIK